jgi:hypothetical protein
VVYNRVIHSGFLEGITMVKWFLPNTSLLVLHSFSLNHEYSRIELTQTSKELMSTKGYIDSQRILALILAISFHKYHASPNAMY